MAKKPAKDGTRRGRESKLTPKVRETILDALKTGCYVETAAQYAGISVGTVWNWLDRGKKERDRLTAFPDTEPIESETIYRDFLEAVETARAAAELRAVAQIQKAAHDGTWQAAAWFLERSAMHRWGRKDRTEITGAEGGTIKVDVASDELEKKIARIVAKREETTG